MADPRKGELGQQRSAQPLKANIREVQPHPGRGTPDKLTRLKETQIGKLYLEHLKKIPLIRRFVIILWRNFYPLYARHIIASHGSHADYRWRPLIKLTHFVETSNSPALKVLEGARVETPPPTVSPAKDQAYLVSPHEHYDFPAVYIAQVKDAQVYGGTNLVFTDDAAICHDLYDFVREYTSEELHGRHLVNAKKKRIRLLNRDPEPERVAMAAAFLDACDKNYAHWLTEVLPRIATFCSIEQYANIPVIVDGGLHSNIMESLALVVGPDREIITLPTGRAINVGVLYVTSVTGYVPFEPRKAKLKNLSQGVFSPQAFDLLRNRLLPFVAKLKHQDWPKKIYLRRASGPRRITNEFEIENILRNNGFVTVQPENQTFVQQLALFSNAESIIGPSGAAFSNQIFAPREAIVHILIGRYRVTSYWYWQNMAAATNKTVKYVLGEVRDGATSGVHADLRVEVQDLLHSISQSAPTFSGH